jgi:hypothetical protein
LYYHIINNQLKYLNDKETAELAKFVILMERGELLQWVKKENGEKIDAVFGSKSVGARIVLSPYQIGTTNTLLDLFTKEFIKAYEGK